MDLDLSKTTDGADFPNGYRVQIAPVNVPKLLQLSQQLDKSVGAIVNEIIGHVQVVDVVTTVAFQPADLQAQDGAKAIRIKRVSTYRVRL